MEHCYFVLSNRNRDIAQFASNLHHIYYDEYKACDVNEQHCRVFIDTVIVGANRHA